MREKLIELISFFGDCLTTEQREIVPNTRIVEIADHLLANGVTVSDCIHDCKNCWKTQLCNPKWIPVTERLPEDRTNILCYVNSVPKGYRQIAWFTQCLEDFCHVDFEGDRRNGFVDYDSEVGYYRLHGVTHWMPLPEPPKGDSI